MALANLLVFGIGKCVTDLIAGWMSDCGPGGRKGVVLIGAGLTAAGCLCIYLAVPGDISNDELDALSAAYPPPSNPRLASGRRCCGVRLR